MTSQEFQQISHTIPNHPGIYKYFDDAGTLIYVGKAKHLRKRVSSYFNKTVSNFKTYELVQRIARIEFTIVDTEQDAFLLENSLIKQFQPKYNIMLKDDKTYPFIVIKKEPFPRVFLTRRKLKDGSEYIGPFTAVWRVREILDFIKENIPLRTCKLNLTKYNIERGKFKVCLEYHLGNCKGPCEGFQSEEDYAESIQQIRQIVKGNLSPLMNHFKKEMQDFAANLQFEKAELIRQKIVALESYQSKSVIVSAHLGNLDVFSISKEHETAYVNYLMVENGTIIHTHTVELQAQIEETEEDILLFAIANLREQFNSFSKEIIVSKPIEFPDNSITITIPKGGDKKKLLELSEKNVNYFKEELRKKKMLRLEEQTENDKQKVLKQLQEDLSLPALPAHIECFDNSNFQGSYPVSAMVCFKNGVPSKKDYRHFNVKTVEGINDFATMKEAVHRRYSRLQREEKPLPQLVIIDGGKGQLSSAMEAIKELSLVGKMTVVGLAKNEEEIFFPGDSQSLKLSWDSESLKLVRRIRDEVHHFGITFHRDKRSKGTFKNELEEITGIGKATAEQLLKRFRSINQIKQLTERELTAEIGGSKAQKVWKYFHEE
ncbi:excinuclease ABC subunit C [Arachidicoccus ginsenosidimutans]|uniref:excinuclease ABC subunit UvrC n=1 Tax=Arachidicoccus sp. BS20 TaxID=1850526 RepID=UPI0007F0E936|nr:excinuclease ABC subunit UvrC [Arachidicoccus sp. BS20]ANI87986.1 excinuclease ABC subunit C [Arachidicoccus sp. BS20]